MVVQQESPASFGDAVADFLEELTDGSDGVGVHQTGLNTIFGKVRVLAFFQTKRLFIGKRAKNAARQVVVPEDVVGLAKGDFQPCKLPFDLFVLLRDAFYKRVNIGALGTCRARAKRVVLGVCNARDVVDGGRSFSHVLPPP